MLNPSRLTVARQRAGLTKKELAQRIGVEPRAITGFEAGQYPPTPNNLERLSRVLGFSIAFLEGDDLELMPAEGVSFRSLSKMTAKHRDSAIAAGSIAFLVSDWVDREFGLPDPDIPDFGGASPDVAATSLRQLWSLGERPIGNMVHLLESKGIRVFSLAENNVEVDAYSVWRGRRPFVFLNTGKSGERRRFDAAHELAHLVLHRHATPNGIEAEKEAHAFAASLLMPTASFKALGRVTPNLEFMFDLKKKWSVALSAVVVRLYELGLISYHHYNRLFVELSSLGYRSKEPTPIKPETSQIWRKVFSELRGEGVGVQALADELLVPPAEIVSLVFGLVTIGLPSSGGALPSPAKAKLTLVK